MLGTVWGWISQWVGIWLDFIIAAGLIVGGGYLEFYLGADPLVPFSGLLRLAGRALIAVGIVVAALAYGKSIGAQDCEASWKAANLQAQLARARQEAAAQRLAAQTAAQQADELAKANDDLNNQVTNYEAIIAKRGGAGCPLTDDDVRRLRNIGGP